MPRLFFSDACSDLLVDHRAFFLEALGLLGEAGLNIADLLNGSRGELAYTQVDVSGPVPDALVTRLRGVPGVLSARRI